MRISRVTSETFTYAINAIVLVYMLVLAGITQKRELWCAIAADVLFTIALAAYRHWREKKPKQLQLQKSLAEVIENNNVLAFLDRGWQAATKVFLVVTYFYLLIDLSAFLLSASGQVTSAQRLYRAIAPPVVTGMHPAFSLELLAGACIEAHEFDRAEILELSLLHIRQSVVGEKHELIAAMMANLGDLYVKQNKTVQAESCYRDAITLTKELRLPQGYGSPMTKLGCVLRDEEHYRDAAQAFTDAIAIRTKIFGPRSEKVAESLKEFAKLRALEGNESEAKRLQSEAATILTSKRPAIEAALAPIVSVLLSLASLVLFAKREEILIWLGRKVMRKVGP